MMKKYRFLVLRRICQIGILLSFALCSHFSYRFLVGDLQSSTLLWKIPMSDPLSVAQILLSGAIVANEALLGLLVVVLIYGIALGRGYCAFVCPMNIISDAANWLRRILGLNAIQKKLNITRKIKYALLVLALVLSAIFATPTFDMISPISMLHRGVIFGMGFGIFGVLAVFLFDLFFVKNGFCGYLCPLGATYGLIGKFSLLRIKHNHTKCTKCMKCIVVCPEPQVLDNIGKKSGTINSIDCIRCARCVEVCDDSALKYGIFDFNKKEER